MPEEKLTEIELNENIVKVEEVSPCTGSGLWPDYPNFKLVETESYHRQGYKGSGVKIAILDTGIGAHSELPIVPISRWGDFVNGRSYTYDDHGHGSFLCGLVHANAPIATLYVGKVLNSNCLGDNDDVIAGIDWAISEGVDIINFSIVEYQGQTIVRDACRDAYNAGIIVVACSGNGTYDPYSQGDIWDWVGGNYVYSPANDYSTVGVGSVDVDRNRHVYSNYGNGLDITAPGGEIVNGGEDYDRYLLSTGPNDNYYYGWGTSFAVAFVVAHLACLKEKYPSIARSALLNKLYSAAVDRGNPTEYGCGVLKAEPLLSSVSEIGTDYIKVIIRYLQYSTITYESFRVRESGSLSWTTYSVGSSNYTDGLNARGYYTSPVLTYSNLIHDTEYELECGVKYNGAWYSRGTIIATTTGISKPSQWSWSQSELNAFNKVLGYSVSDVTYQRWNAFLDRVEEFRIYYNSKYGTGVPSVLSYKMTSSDKTLTATRFNGVRYAIGSMNATGITDVSKDDPVLGWYFTRLSDRLNAIT